MADAVFQHRLGWKTGQAFASVSSPAQFYGSSRTNGRDQQCNQVHYKLWTGEVNSDWRFETRDLRLEIGD